MNNSFLTHSTVGSIYEAVFLDAVKTVYLGPLFLKNKQYKKADESVKDWIYLHTYTPSTYCFSFYVISHTVFQKDPQELAALVDTYLESQWGEEEKYYAQALYHCK